MVKRKRSVERDPTRPRSLTRRNLAAVNRTPHRQSSSSVSAIDAWATAVDDERDASVQDATPHGDLTASSEYESDYRSRASSARSVHPSTNRFRIILEELGIRTVERSNPPLNLAEIREHLDRPIPQETSDEDLEYYLAGLRVSEWEEDELAYRTLPILLGPEIVLGGYKRLYEYMEPFDDRLSKPKPKLFDASDIYELKIGSEKSRLSRYIRPSEAKHVILPNFVLEVVGGSGSCATALKQAAHAAAMGVRAMSSLQALEDPEHYRKHECRAYVLSIVLWETKLEVYAHSEWPPSERKGPREYHMWHVASSMANESREALHRTRQLMRNSRDYTRQCRDTAIAEANQRHLAAQERLDRSRSRSEDRHSRRSGGRSESKGSRR